MHACMHACTYVRVHVCTYVRMYVRTYVRTYVRMYVCMCIHPNKNLGTHIDKDMYVYREVPCQNALVVWGLGFRLWVLKERLRMFSGF